MCQTNYKLFSILCFIIFSLPFGMNDGNRDDKTFLIQNVGNVSSVLSWINERNYMEDYFIRSETNGIFAVFDGHDGGYAAKHAEKTIRKLITDYIWWYKINPYRWMSGMDFKETVPIFIAAVESQLKTAYRYGLHRSGTTCLVIVAEKTKLTVANVGDSRAVIGDKNGKVIDATVDHKPENLKERKRIETAGGRVYCEDDDCPRINGLAMSRSLGDFAYGKISNGISALPDMYVWDLEKYKTAKFVILATDGLWDDVPSDEAVKLVKEWHLTQSDFGANQLATLAKKRGAIDNITIIIIVFRDGFYEVGSTSLTSLGPK